MAVEDEFVEVGGLLSGEPMEALVIEDEQVGSEERPEGSVHRVVHSGLSHGSEEVVGMAEAHGVPGAGRTTVGADRGYDTRGFVRRCRKSRVTPQVAKKQRSDFDRRTTRHDGYRFSQRARKRS